MNIFIKKLTFEILTYFHPLSIPTHSQNVLIDYYNDLLRMGENRRGWNENENENENICFYLNVEMKMREDETLDWK